MEKEKLTDKIIKGLEGDTLNEKLEAAILDNYNIMCFLAEYIKENKRELLANNQIEAEKEFINYKFKDKVFCFRKNTKEGLVYWHNK